MSRVLPHAPAVQADSDQSKTNDQSRDQHVIGFGQPSGESDRSEHDSEQWRCTADRDERAANDVSRDEGAVTHGISFWAQRDIPHLWSRE
jgi:hypothetical protein